LPSLLLNSRLNSIVCSLIGYDANVDYSTWIKKCFMFSSRTDHKSAGGSLITSEESFIANLSPQKKRPKSL
jgi:hypothetical protein